MEIAILTVGAVAAVAAVAAVVVPLWQQRVRLDLRLTGGFSTFDDRIEFGAVIENNGRSPIFHIELFCGPPGLLLSPGSRYYIGKVTLDPVSSYPFTCSLPRPGAAESTPNGVVLPVPLLVVARYGRRLKVIEHPVGPFNSGTVKEGSLRRPSAR